MRARIRGTGNKGRSGHNGAYMEHSRNVWICDRDGFGPIPGTSHSHF